MRPSDDTESKELPEALREALGTAARHEIEVPPAVDEAILEDARLHLREIRTRRPVILALRTAALGLAACAVLAIGLDFFSPTPSKSRPAELALSRDTSRAAEIGPEDIDGNGRIDILDAFTLARRIERGAGHTAWDFNRDGVVDRGDVDLVAMAAVRLPGFGKEAAR